MDGFYFPDFAVSKISILPLIFKFNIQRYNEIKIDTRELNGKIVERVKKNKKKGKKISLDRSIL